MKLKRIPLLLICLFLGVLLSLPAAAWAGDTAKDAKKAYARFLGKKNAIGSFSGAYPGSFSIQDLNADGIPELCAYEGEDGRYARNVYAYVNGEVKLLLEGSKYVSYYGCPDSGLFIYVWSRSDRGEFNDMYLFDGETLEKMIAREYSKSTDEKLWYDYRHGGEDEISEARFDRIYEDLKGGEEPSLLFTEYYRNTPAKRKAVIGYRGGDGGVDGSGEETGLQTASRGVNTSDYPFNLDDYAYRTVVTNNDKGALVFQSSPNGSFLNDYQFWNGDQIFVNLYWRQDGYAIACKDGVYGYVDAGYINWSNEPADDRYNLSDYGYRTVVTKNRGSLVFQEEPDGGFLYDYEFWNGDVIYVNLSWRQDGYAIAYQDGEYGYVDASYIDWDSTAYEGGDTGNRYDLSNYRYRTVSTGKRGALVFQSAPNGAFLNDYQFKNGDRIFVNLYWRKDGYAIACKDGVYGYVDASYISW